MKSSKSSKVLKGSLENSFKEVVYMAKEFLLQKWNKITNQYFFSHTGKHTKKPKKNQTNTKVKSMICCVPLAITLCSPYGPWPPIWTTYFGSYCD